METVLETPKKGLMIRIAVQAPLPIKLSSLFNFYTLMKKLCNNFIKKFT